MITVIISGGAGTRLWPLSTHNRPKQLIPLVKGVAPLREAIDRVKDISDHIYVLPESRLVKDIERLLPELDSDHLIVEPALRGTANCYALALDHVRRRHDHDEPIAFIWADHHVRDVTGFQHTIRKAVEVTTKSGRLVTVGIEPSYPAQFGYIEKGDDMAEMQDAYSVASFKEKPPLDVAQDYIDSGNYLWNTGYYVGTIGNFLAAIERYSPTLHDSYQMLSAIEDTSSEAYTAAYHELENLVIEYELSEKASDLAVVPATFDWMDIGNFKDLYDASSKDDAQNIIAGAVHIDDVTTSYINNTTDVPVAVIGLDNVVVVTTEDGILVARKDVSVRVGEIAKQIKKQS